VAGGNITLLSAGGSRPMLLDRGILVGDKVGRCLRLERFCYALSGGGVEEGNGEGGDDGFKGCGLC